MMFMSGHVTMIIIYHLILCSLYYNCVYEVVAGINCYLEIPTLNFFSFIVNIVVVVSWLVVFSAR